MTAEEKLKRIEEFASYIIRAYTKDTIVDMTARSVAKGILAIISEKDIISEKQKQ